MFELYSYLLHSLKIFQNLAIKLDANMAIYYYMHSASLHLVLAKKNESWGSAECAGRHQQGAAGRV